MRQLTYVEPRKLEWWDVPEPTLDEPEQALVEPVCVATCDLDPFIAAGRTPYAPPIALGHEAIARVVAVGEGVRSARPGDLVAVPFQISCGRCGACRAGRTGNCESVPFLSMYGFGAIAGSWGGALADVVRVPFAEHMLVPLPDQVDPAAVASLGDNIADGWRTVAGPLADRPGAEVLVMAGSASIGLYAAGAALALGAQRVTYVDEDAARLERARQLGAEVVEGTGDGLGPYPITVDVSGDADRLRTVLRATAPDGVCTCAAIYFDPPELPLLEMYTKCITFHTGRAHARALMPDALSAVADGRLHPELVTAATVAWSDAAEALLEQPGKLVFVREPEAKL